MNGKNALLSLLLTMTVSVPAAVIKTGDVLDIQVVGQTAFSGRFVVHQNGTIDYPLLADVVIVNNTTSELMNDLTLRLARNIDNPLVLISVVQKPEISVTVLGQVAKPGPVVVYQGATIQEIIHGAGGVLQESADIEQVKIIHKTRQPASEVCNLKKFLVEGDLEHLPILDAGDVVIVPAMQKTRKVKMIGAVQKPGLFTLEEKTNLFEIVYLAGGPAEKADLTRVRRLSQQSGKTMEEVIDLQAYIDKGKMDEIPVVSEGDIVIVYTKWFDGKTMLTLLNNTLLVIVAIQAFAGVFK
ncbi:MAG: SLBB domain-containing protein [Chitinispirillaceae bacterium]|nr:SLBB domain-containing protein [Chitinispirillaceae bacterium]